MYVVLAVFSLMGISQNPTFRSYHGKNWMLTTAFLSETLPLETPEGIIKFMQFSCNSMRSEFQGPPRLFKIYLVSQHINNTFQNLYVLNQNTFWQINPWLYGKVFWLSGNTYLSRLPNWASKHLNSLILALAMFPPLICNWVRHGTNESVCYCRNK
jgi:hypothetical protein